MKAITLMQPWATLVAIGAKRLETRSWSTNYRGPLAIHAGANTRFIDPNSPPKPVPARGALALWDWTPPE